MARKKKESPTEVEKVSLIVNEPEPDTDKDLNQFKIEANLSIFGTPVDIKPMEGSEIGYRAPEGDDGIVISKAALVDAGIIEADGTAIKLIPDSTSIKTLIYDYKRQNIEFAVEAKFMPGRLPKTYLDKLKGRCKDKRQKDTFIKWLIEQINARAKEKVPARGENESNDAYIDKLIPVLDTLGDDAFILNRYPQVFTVNSVFIYVGPNKEIEEEEEDDLFFLRG